MDENARAVDYRLNAGSAQLTEYGMHSGKQIVKTRRVLFFAKDGQFAADRIDDDRARQSWIPQLVQDFIDGWDGAKN
jgi:hypothetical protein